jgi:hypothetical protein
MPKINEDKFIEVNSTYGSGVAVSIYKNEYSLVSATKNKEGDIWADWCFLQNFVDGKRIPSEKTIPVKITLGLKEQAIQRLEQLLSIIEGR